MIECTAVSRTPIRATPYLSVARWMGGNIKWKVAPTSYWWSWRTGADTCMSRLSESSYVPMVGCCRSTSIEGGTIHFDLPSAEHSKPAY